MDNFSMLVEPIRETLHQIAAFVPRLVLAIVLLIVGWLIARAVRFAIVKALRAAGGRPGRRPISRLVSESRISATLVLSNSAMLR